MSEVPLYFIILDTQRQRRKYEYRFELIPLEMTNGSNRGEYSPYILGRSIYSTNLYKMLCYNH